MAYAAMKQYEKAQDFYGRALAMARDGKAKADECDILRNASLLYIKLHQFDKAQSYLEQALTIARENRNKHHEALILSSLGQLYKSLNQFEKAVDYQEQSLKIAQETNSAFNENYAFLYLASLYSNLSQYEKAQSYLEQSLVKSRERKNRILEAITLVSLGNVYFNLNQYEKARDDYEQGLAIAKELKQRELEGGTIVGIGAIYADLSQNQKAQNSYEQSLAMMKEALNRRSEGQIRDALGHTYLNLKEYKKAKDYFEQALAIAREVKERSDEANALINLGEAYSNLKQYGEAQNHYEQGLLITREVKHRSSEGYALNGLGEVNQKLKQFEKAQDYYRQALAVAREIKSRKIEGKVLWNFMTLSNEQKNPRLAVFYGKQAINAFQEIRGNIRDFDKETQQSFLKDKESAYRTLADILISQGRLPEAQQVLMMLKENEYFDFIRRDGNAAKELLHRADLNPDERAALHRYSEKADHLAIAQQKYAELSAKAGLTSQEQDQLNALDAEIEDANRAFLVFLRQLSDEFGKPGEKQGSNVNETTALASDLRDWGEGVATLSTIVGDDRYRVILTTKRGRLWRETKIKGVDLDRLVLEFRFAVENPNVDPRPLAQRLYQYLIAPVAKDLEAAGAKTLVWSLDGTLRYLPIAALYDGKQYLAEKYANVIITLASRTRLDREPSSTWHGLGLGVSEKAEGFLPLYAVSNELFGIIHDDARKDQTGGLIPGRVLLNREFNEPAMKAALKQAYSLVHIASHFVFKPSDKESFLLLGNNEHLTLDQVRISPTPFFDGVELLALSACDTAIGGGSNGEEVESFAVLAQIQGARAVMATLWPVADHSTQEFMRRFYENRVTAGGVLRERMTKAEALRQAQLALLRGQIKGQPSESRKAVADSNLREFKADPNALWSHPYYWAPFVLIGNWK